MRKIIVLFVLVLSVFAMSSCESTPQQQVSDSGVKKATVKDPTDVNGNTTEQINIIKRLIRDNEVGSIKHLYVISCYTGDVLEYSTVQGKVTSGSKRLSPKTVYSSQNFNYMEIVICGQSYVKT